MWRGMYDSYASMHQHHDELMRLVEDLIDQTDATLSRFEIHGPSQDLVTAANLDASLALKSDYFDTIESSFGKLITPSNRERVCETNELFVVNDWTKAGPIMKDFLEKTAREPGCTYSGWSKKGDQLRWVETYTDGAAVAKHFEITGPIIDKLLEGAATLQSAEVHGPKNELEMLKNLPRLLKAEFKPKFFAIASDGSEEQILQDLVEISDKSDKSEL